MDGLDITSIGAAAGIGGTLTLLITQVIKEMTGWSDRRAFQATLFVALMIAVGAWAAEHWNSVREAWGVILAWMGNIAAGTGIYSKVAKGSKSNMSKDSGESDGE